MWQQLAKVPRGAGDHHLAHNCNVEVISHEHQLLTYEVFRALTLLSYELALAKGGWWMLSKLLIMHVILIKRRVGFTSASTPLTLIVLRAPVIVAHDSFDSALRL